MHYWDFDLREKKIGKKTCQFSFMELRFCFPDQSVMESFHICNVTALRLGNNLNDRQCYSVVLRRMFQADMTAKEKMKGISTFITLKIQYCGWMGNMDLLLADKHWHLLQWNWGICVMQRSIHTWHVLYLGTPRPAGEHQCFLSMGTSFAPFWLLVMGVDGRWEIQALLWIQCSQWPALAHSTGLVWTAPLFSGSWKWLKCTS